MLCMNIWGKGYMVAKVFKCYLRGFQDFLVVQWIGICLQIPRGHGFDPWSRKIPYAMED